MTVPDRRLNLARALRPKTFSEVKGQELSVRLLKNSLYKGMLFPVYLFAGLRGSGKTTTARIFSAALNCHALGSFQKDPHQEIPCWKCPSCEQMARGSHPDFVEVDAASYTGVDTIRSIIEAAVCAPVLGRVRIYLIDEAHMLSKAAFNALLKMLEEPPAHVHFVLATTDPQKILDTVRSRSFQVVFNPVSHAVLVEHLAEVCTKEGLVAEVPALERIARDAQGSVRDALNLLERVRLLGEKITVSEVVQVLGTTSHHQWTPFIKAVLSGDAHAVALHTPHFEMGQAHEAAFAVVADYLHELLRAVATKTPVRVYGVHKDVEDLVAACMPHSEQLLVLVKVVYEYERQLITTRNAEQMWMFVGWEAQRQVQASVSRASERSSSSTRQRLVSVASSAPVLGTGVSVQPTPSVSCTKQASTEPTAGAATGSSPLEALAGQDAVIHSLMLQAQMVVEEQHLTIRWPKRFQFYTDMLESKKAVWHEYVCSVYKVTTITLAFDAPSSTAGAAPQAVRTEVPASVRTPTPARDVSAPGYRAPQYRLDERKSAPKLAPELDVSDKEQWRKTHELLEFFPGTVRKVVET